MVNASSFFGPLHFVKPLFGYVMPLLVLLTSICNLIIILVLSRWDITKSKFKDSIVNWVPTCIKLQYTAVCRTLWRYPSDQLVRVYNIPVSQLSHLDMVNIKVGSHGRCHLKDNSKLYSDVQKYFINLSLPKIPFIISVIVNVTIIFQIKLDNHPYNFVYVSFVIVIIIF